MAPATLQAKRTWQGRVQPLKVKNCRLVYPAELRLKIAREISLAQDKYKLKQF